MNQNPAAALLNALTPAQARQALVASVVPARLPGSGKQALIDAVEYALSQDHATRGLEVVAVAYPVPVTELPADANPVGRSFDSKQEGRVGFYTRPGHYDKPVLAYTAQGTLLTLRPRR